MKRILIPLVCFAAACDPVIDEEHFDEPKVLALVPDEGASSGGFQVAISGNFCGAPHVTIDGLAPLDVQSADPQQIVLTFPPHAIGDAEVRVACGDGRPVASDNFRYYATSIVLQTNLTAPAVDKLLGFADFDGDGIDDMAGLFFVDGAVKIFPGTRWNEFLSEPIAEIDGLSTAGALNAVSSDLRDRDGDGRADLTLLENWSDSMRIARLFARSTDDFRPAIFMATSTVSIEAVVSADLDDDGLPDVIAVEDSTLIAIRTGVDPGRQRRTLVHDIQTSAFFIPFVADVDGDGIEDLVVGPDRGFQDFYFIYGSPSGAYRITESHESNSGKLIDFDGDPWPDVYDFRDGAIQLRRGIGPGVFGDVERHPVRCDGCINVFSASIGPFDFDRDGKLERVFAGVRDLLWVDIESGDTSVVGMGSLIGAARFGRESLPALIYEQDGVLKSAYAVHPTIGGTGPTEFRSAPPLINNRGWSCYGDVGGKDVSFGPAQSADDRLLIRERDERGFGPERELEISGDTSALFAPLLAICTAVHLDGDRGDFVIWLDPMVPASVVRFEASGAVSVTALPYEPNGKLSGFWAIERPDGSGRGAIVRATEDATMNLEVYELENGALKRTAFGTLTPAGTTALTGQYALIDDDDVVDAIFRFGNTVDLFVGRRDASGELTFTSRRIASGLERPTLVREIDVDDDGDWDLTVETDVEPKEVFVFENDGHGQMTPTARIDRVFDMDVLDACDLDGDDRPELVFAMENALAVARRLRDGTYDSLQTFTTRMQKPLPVFQQTVCRDVDGDGLNDVLEPEYYVTTKHVFRNRSR